MRRKWAWLERVQRGVVKGSVVRGVTRGKAKVGVVGGGAEGRGEIERGKLRV